MRTLIVSFFVLLISLIILIADLSTIPARTRQSINPAFGPHLADKRSAASICFPAAEAKAGEAAGVRIRAFIGGSDIIKLRENKLWIEHLTYELPGTWDNNNFPVHVDNDQWMPKWHGSNISDNYFLSKTYLPMADVEVRIAPITARGILKIAEQPTKENNYTLALFINDVPGGSVWYDLAIAWKKAPEVKCLIGTPTPPSSMQPFSWGTKSQPPAIAQELSDSVLNVYRINSAQEEQLNVSEGALTSLWDVWKIKKLSQAQIRPFTEKIFENSFKNENDARMTVSAAYGSKGIYLLCDVVDDEILDARQTAEDGDIVDIVFDADSSAMIYDNAPQCYLTSEWGLTRHSIQYQYPFNSDSRIDFFGVNHLNPKVVLVKNGPDNFATVVCQKFTPAEVLKKYGVRAKKTLIGKGHVALQWSIPWSAIGYSKITRTPFEGRKFAMSLEYADVDSENISDKKVVSMKKITWGGRGDPWNNTRNGWGDLELGGPLP